MSKSNLFGKRFIPKILIAILALLVLIPIAAVADSEDRSIDRICEIVPDSTLLKNKVVYVDFWASWCIPCRKSFPWMSEMMAKYKDSGLVIVTINVDKNKEAAKKFLVEHQLNSISLFDPNGETAKTFALEVMPSSFVYDSSGKLQYVHQGFNNKETKEIEEKLISLLHGEKINDEQNKN